MVSSGNNYTEEGNPVDTSSPTLGVSRRLSAIMADNQRVNILDDVDDRSIDDEPIEANSEEEILQIFDLDTIIKLQRKEMETREKGMSFFDTLNKLKERYFSGNYYSEFERTILNQEPNDCSLVAKYSKLEDVKLVRHKSIKELVVNILQISHPLRVYHERNAEDIESQEAKEFISKLDELPVIVFVHGLGGQMSQFEPAMALLSQCADIFSLDLPGFGNSKPINPKSNAKYNMLSKFDQKLFFKMQEQNRHSKWEDFTTESIVDLVYELLMIKYPNRKFIFIAHSMGTHISTKVINKFGKGFVESLILLCPPEFRPENDTSSVLPMYQRLFLGLSNYVPELFDYYRYSDRIGGLQSKSVNSFIYQDANEESNDPHLIFKRLRQLRWNLDTDSRIFLKYLYGFNRATEEELSIAIKNMPQDNYNRFMVIGAENDKVTPISRSDKVNEICHKENIKITYNKIKNANHSIFLDKPELTSGLILQFIDDIKSLNISIPWCLQVKALINGDKWGMKNLLKWSKIKPISSEIVNPTNSQVSPLLGMKTLRESDDTHNPVSFEVSHPEVYAIINIGSDLPSYNPDNFQRIKYVKFPTVSKIIPDSTTVRKFITLVDELLLERQNDSQKIVVHCHYGFNRTGYLIACYNTERLKWRVSDSVEAFKLAKEPGIKHPHFIDGLYIRYEK